MHTVVTRECVYVCVCVCAYVFVRVYVRVCVCPTGVIQIANQTRDQLCNIYAIMSILFGQ